ncbi:MAG: hypothetical protein F6K10_35210, partial [Moorea sp. SIO2B7]|nr:hypothetical protein [Moorena sp. SIO2B7]
MVKEDIYLDEKEKLRWDLIDTLTANCYGNLAGDSWFTETCCLVRVQAAVGRRLGRIRFLMQALTSLT